MLDVAVGAAEAPARGQIDERELRAAGIAAIGAAVPPRAVANDAIGERLGVDGEWISTRTGVHERRVAAADATLTDLAAESAGPALERAGIAPAEVDLVLLATSTPDEIVPNAAPFETPSKYGSARGFLNNACREAPATASDRRASAGSR